MKTTCSQHEWTAPDGETFSYSLWEPELLSAKQPKAVMISVHGLSGASLDFEPLGSHLRKDQVITFALELRGQGNDPVVNRRGDLEQIETWFADLSAFFALVRGRYPSVPVYYYGESMGAALLTRFLAQADERDLPSGVVLASPVVTIPGKPGWWKQFVFHFFLWLQPARRVDISKYTKREDHNDPAKWVTRDEAHRRWFETAPHKIDSYTFRFFKCLFELIGGCFEAAPNVKVPVLVAYATNDVFIPPAQVEEFFRRLGSRDKELCLFPESYHLLLHDFDKAQALELIEGWLLRHMAEAPPVKLT